MRLGVPQDSNSYDLQRINDIDVYVPKDFNSPHQLTIEVQSLFGIKTLHLEGWKLI